MPIVGEIDVSGILAKLGDPTHGLSATRPKTSGLEDRDEPYRAAYGAIDMSMSMALAVVPKIVWDVNGYYRSLGIDIPYKPSRRQLREAYQEADGQASERLTYYLKQLIQPEVREEYDSMPLGTLYRDKYVIERDKRLLTDKAKEVSEEEGRIVTAQDLMEEYDREHEDLTPLPPSAHIWNWGFYALKSRKYDTELLERWQRMLSISFTERGFTPTISIGYIGGTREEYAIQEHEGRHVIFLNEEIDPTIELAETAVSTYMAQRRKALNDRGNRSTDRRGSGS